MENIDRNQDDVILAHVPMKVGRAARRSRGVAGVHHFLAPVRKPNLICSLHEIDDGGAIFVTMDTNVAAWLNREHAHPELPASHALDLGA